MKFKKFYLCESNNKLALFIGRLQPPHKGHEQIINDALKDNDRVVMVVVDGKTTGKQKKNFLSFEERKKLIKKINPKIEIVKSHTAFIGFILYKLLKLTDGDVTVYAGPDRIDGYNKSEKDNKFYNFTFKETPRITSATEVRKTLQNDDYNSYKKISAKKLNDKKTFEYLKDLWNKKQLTTESVLVEGVVQSKRVGIEHFQQMKPLTFINLMKTFQKEFKGVLKTTDGIKFKEKFDGFNLHFGIDKNKKFFIESSHSGPVFQSKAFSKFNIEKHGVSNKISDAYDNVLQKLKTSKPLISYLKKTFPEGIKIQSEVLYNPLGDDFGDKINFIATKYDKSKLGSLATMVIYNLKNLDGTPRTDFKELSSVREKLKSFSNKEIKFYDDTTKISKIDISVEVDDFNKMISNYKNLETLLVSRKKVQRLEALPIKQAISKYQIDIGEKLISHLRSGKLGSEFEGLIIELSDGKMYKLISNTFKTAKKTFDLKYKG